MAIVVFEHHPLETAGRLGIVLQELGHRLDILPLYEDASVPADFDGVDGILVMGGPQDTDQQDQHAWMTPEIDYIREAHKRDIPVVGICLGAQLIATALGGEVGRMEQREIGFGNVKSSFFGTTDPIHAGIPWDTMQFHAHGCEVTKAPPGGTPIPLSSSKQCKCQAFRVGLTTYGFQYHFEWTRPMIQEILADDPDFYGSGPTDIDTIRASIDEYYDLYRHLGDRLSRNIVNLLYPVDKRLAPSGADVTNFRSS
jgi:GMP synthase-like glutamine amidotransferase